MFVPKWLGSIMILVLSCSVTVVGSAQGSFFSGGSRASALQRNKKAENLFSSDEVDLIAPVTPAVASKITYSYIRPKALRRIVEHFTPWDQADPQQVQTIIAVEAQRWGASAARLSCRIYGESSDQWWERNGQYTGLGQFAANTFSRGMSTIETRRVRWVQSLSTWRWVQRLKYQNGILVSRNYHWRHILVREMIVHQGTIPRNPPITHSWAQVRIMAQAMVGISAVKDSEWQVRC